MQCSQKVKYMNLGDSLVYCCKLYSYFMSSASITQIWDFYTLVDFDTLRPYS